MNIPAAAILTLSILFYVLVYTVWLKRRTPQNIVIGGAAGAFPPIVGWASVTGDIGLNDVLVPGIAAVTLANRGLKWETIAASNAGSIGGSSPP